MSKLCKPIFDDKNLLPTNWDDLTPYQQLAICIMLGKVGKAKIMEALDV